MKNKRPIIVWVDEDTEEILVEEYVPVSDGDFTTSTHMELTYDHFVTIPDDDQLVDDLDVLTRIAYAAAGRESQAIATRVRTLFRLDEKDK